MSDPRFAIDEERLGLAIYAVSVIHDWANTTDTQDRTHEIAEAYRKGMVLVEKPYVRFVALEDIADGAVVA